MSLGFDSFPGNSAVKNSLRAALNSRFPQAVLLSGPTGAGKAACARTLAAALLCTGAPVPCGVCPSCRKIADNAHPDLLVLDPGDSEIKVDDARRIRAQAAVLPNEGSRKVFILHSADRMNVSAQNALLKVLEEPPAYAFFILTAVQPGALLQTVRSRCTQFQLAPPRIEAEPDPALLTPVSDFLQALSRRDEFAMLAAANGLASCGKPAFQQAMGLLQTALRDALLPELSPLLPALRPVTTALAGTVSRRALLALCDHAALLSDRAEVNTAPVIQCAALAAGAYQICFGSPAGQTSHIGGTPL